MASVRRAFVWATAGRYLIIVINLAATIVVARLVAPASFGVSVLGGSAYAIAEAVREIGGGAYLIQQGELSEAKVRTSISMSLIVTIVMTAALSLCARPLAEFYDDPGVERYLRVAALAYLLGPFIYPNFALMSRAFAFGSIALVTVSMALANAVSTVALALLGFEAMSFAWANLISAIVGAVLCLYFQPNRSNYRPTLSEWRSVVTFGAFDSLTSLGYALGEYAPYLVLGRFLAPSDLAIAQRGVSLTFVPERVVLAGVGAVALPTLSRLVREKRELKQAYLSALELITAVHWPALVVLGLLASPLVTLVYGRQWHEVAPLLPILSLAFAFSFPGPLQYPVLVAVGAIRLLPALVAVQALLTTMVIGLSAKFGLHAVAASLVVAVPANSFLSMSVVRRYAGFTWVEAVITLRKSAVIVVTSAIGPLVILLGSGGFGNPSAKVAVLAVISSAVGWGFAMRFTRHPLLDEMWRARDALSARLAGRFSSK